MEVCTVHVSNGEDMKRFFCTVFCVVHSLLIHPIETMVSSALTVTPEVLSSRAVRCNDMVQKYYDTECEPFCVPTLPLIKSLGEYGLSQPSVHILSDNQRLQRLDCEYVDGSHRPRSDAQVAMIILGLDMIHKNQYVHSDIREQNLVFSSDGKNAYIIDFDLTDKVNTVYPECYNTNLSERHRKALPYKERKQPVFSPFCIDE